MKFTWILIIGTCCSLSFISGCRELADWRDSQVKVSHDLGQGSQIVIPDPPVTVPTKLYETLPLEDGFTILVYNDNRSSVEITVDALVNRELEDLSIWLLRRMTELGYGSDDNACRILEGTVYSPAGPRSEYAGIYVKAEFADSGCSLLHLKALTKQ